MTERYLTPETEEPSDPEAPALEDDTTKSIVIKLRSTVESLRDSAVRAQGAATVWRAAGATAVTVALGLATWGISYAQQAAVDHDRVGRVEEDVGEVTDDVDAIRDDLDAIRSALARIEGRLDSRREDN